MVLVITTVTSMVHRLQEQKTLLDELFEQALNAVALVNNRSLVVRINREFTNSRGLLATLPRRRYNVLRVQAQGIGGRS